MTASEKFVHELCDWAFLKLWSHANPIGKKGKELCDILIVCGNDIIIFSVKHIEIKSTSNLQLDDERWIKRAVDDSVKQIYGAERIIDLKEKILLKDRTAEIELPEKNERRIHRIAVAVGRRERYSLKFGDFGKGFIHVFDEESIHAVLTELDTITDFLDYLKAKENLISSGTYPLYATEKNFLAYYILSNNSFSDIENPNLMIFEEDLWEGMKSDVLYLQLKEGKKESYFWDEIINTFIVDHLNNELTIPIDRNRLDPSIRMMAFESRFSRKILSNILLEFIGYNCEIKSESRIVKSISNPDIIYVFLLIDPTSEDRDSKITELNLRCYAARQIMQEGNIVIGLGLCRFESKGYSYDLCAIDTRIWDEKEQRIANNIISELGFFKDAIRYDKNIPIFALGGVPANSNGRVSTQA